MRTSRHWLSWKTRQAGGLDPFEMTVDDYYKVLAVIAPESLSDKDLVHATYVFNYLAGVRGSGQLANYADKLATAYARRYAEWLGFVFVNRANLTNKSKSMKALEEGLGNWAEAIPGSFRGAIKPPSDYLTPEAEKFLDMTKVDALGTKVVRVVRADWEKATGGRARMAASDKFARDDLSALPITYDPVRKLYKIPKSQLTYKNRAKLRQLGFEFTNDMWVTEVLDTKILEELPQVAELSRDKEPEATPDTDPVEWFFEKWLPANIDRFSSAFNSYAKMSKVPYKFRFQVIGREVVVTFERMVGSINEAITELQARYGKDKDRDGWLEAIDCYKRLRSVSGRQAMIAVDVANNLEHSHGAMMEHFPPGVRSWYPHFLDFKYTAHIEQMVKKIEDRDLMVCARELLPNRQIRDRLVTPQTDHRTPKGLVLEIASQPGKAKKRQMLQAVIKTTPKQELNEIFALLNERGLILCDEQKEWAEAEAAEAKWLQQRQP